MPTDANGTYTLPPSYFVQNGDPIQPVQHNPPLEDLQQGMTDRVMRDGRAPMTGDLHMDAHKIVGLADGVAPGDAATVLQMQQAVPAGAVMAFARNTAPTGWLACQGQAVSRATYAALFAAIGTTFGAGNGSSTFNLPNMRGQFVRGWNDTASGIDASRAFGSMQEDQNKQHTHGASTGSAGAHTHAGTAVSGGSHTHTASTGSAGNHTHTGTTSTDTHSHYVAGDKNPGDYDYGLNFIGPDFVTTTNARNTRADTSSDSHSHTLTTNSTGAHTHSVTVNSGGAHTHSLSVNSAGAHTHAVTVENEGGSEARPHNIALLYCIKT